MRISTDCPRNDAVRESRIWGKSPGCRQRRKREEKRCVSLNSPLVAGTMSVSVRRFLQRRAEASSGAAAFAAGDASSPRASVPGDAARFSPGTAGGRFGAESAGSPGDDSASPERTTRLDYYPDDIVPTPRHGDDTSGDEGVHPNDDPSSPTWHAAPHRSPLAFSFRGRSSSNAATKRSAPSATRRPPSIPRAGGMVVAPGPHADVLPRRHAGALLGAFHGAGAGAPPRALRHPADDVDPAPARFPRAEKEGKQKHTKTKNAPRAPPATSPTATPTTARVSSWASPTRARHASAHPGGARGAPDRGTFSQAMREAETIAALGGEVAGARARLVALAGDVLETRESRASFFGRRRVRDFTRDRGDRYEKSKSIEHLRPVSRLGVESELKRLLRVCSKDDATRARNRKGADRRVAFFFHRRAGAPVAAAARRNEGWLTTQARPARMRVVTSNAKRPMKHTDRTNVNVPRLAFGRSIDDVSRAATMAFGSESRAAAAFAERDATARATGWAGRMASDAERMYADVWTDSLDSLDSLEKQIGRSEKSQALVISTKTPRLWIRSGSADSARFRVGGGVRHGEGAGM